MARILVIDDDGQVRSMLRMTLEREGYEVEEAPDGRVGMRLFYEKPTDLVITDIVMPEKEGIETIRELSQDSPRTKIIAISGGGSLNSMTYLLMAGKLGASRAFSKPVDQVELLKAVREFIAEP